MLSNLITLQVHASIATIYLNRPEKRNAMSDAMRAEFIVALERVSADKSIRALVLTGNGKGFCAGGDVAGMERRMQAPPGEVGFNGWHRQQRVLHPAHAGVYGAAQWINQVDKQRMRHSMIDDPFLKTIDAWAQPQIPALRKLLGERG